MNWQPISSALYTILTIFGFALLVLGAEAQDAIDTIVGMGACTLGVLGIEAQAIYKSIRELKEVDQS